MPLTHAMYAAQFDPFEPPHLTCGDCGNARIHLDTKSLLRRDDRGSRAAARELAPPDYTEWGYFRCDFACEAKQCGTAGTMIGRYSSTMEQIDMDDYSTEYRYYPTAFEPSPRLFIPPHGVPETLLEPLYGAFSLFWAHPAACASRCRMVIERLLDHLGVVQTSGGKTGKRTRLTLHARIEKLAGKNPKLAEILFAAKWLGNDGAHKGKTTAEDAVDALNIVEAALVEVFAPDPNAVLRVAREINKRKGPRSRRRTRDR